MTDFGTIVFDHYNQREHDPIDASFPTFSYTLTNQTDASMIPVFLQSIVSYPLLLQFKEVDLSSAMQNQPIIVQYHYVLQSIAQKYMMEDFKCLMEVKAYTEDGIQLPISPTGKNNTFIQHYHDQRLSPNTLQLPFLTSRNISKFWLYMRPIKMYHKNNAIDIESMLGSMVVSVDVLNPAPREMLIQSSTSSDNNSNNIIKFSDTCDPPYGFLSNAWTGAQWGKDKQQIIFRSRHVPFVFRIDQEQWMSVEHYYQSARFRLPPVTNQDNEETIQRWIRHDEYISYMKRASTVNKVKRLGEMIIKKGREVHLMANNNDSPTINSLIRQYSNDVTQVPDWEIIRTGIMMRCLLAKFSHDNPILRQQLLSTGTNDIQYVNPKDLFWGMDDKKNTGENRLGGMLVVVRNMIRSNLM